MTGIFSGFWRSDGSVGVRNHLLVVPSVICANQVCARIAEEVPGAIAIPHQHGCSQVGPDAALTHGVLSALGRHPNVGAVLVVSLGCEVVNAPQLAEEIAASGRTVEWLRIQDVGGSIKAIAEGTRIARSMKADLHRALRVPTPLAELTLALKCGAVDETVWQVANPILGGVADRHLDAGGSVLVGETAELAACTKLPEHWSHGSRAAVTALIDQYRQVVGRVILDTGDESVLLPVAWHVQQAVPTYPVAQVVNPSGAVAKIGHRPLAGVLPYAARVPGRGLWFMDTPVADVPGVTGLVAGGAHIVLFATGSGTPIGSPVTPVIKITANAETVRRWQDHIDADLSRIPGANSRAVEILLSRCLSVADGEETAAEILGHTEFGIHRVGISL